MWKGISQRDVSTYFLFNRPPGKWAELKSLLKSVCSIFGSDFLGSMYYEVLDNPNILVEISDWAAAEARAAATNM